MSTLSNKQKVISWIFQIIAATILLKAASGKFMAHEMSVYVFDEVKMGEGGRIIIGILEGLAALLLITKNLPHLGALLGFGIMLGALIAHSTVLGINVQGDGGASVMTMLVVIISSFIVMYIRRKKLPLIGHTLN